jgi:hypothetical protein
MIPITKRYDIYIFGYGSRVKKDIIPVIDILFPNSNKIIYATSRKKINVNGKIEIIRSFDEFVGTYQPQNNIAFISVPPAEQFRVFNRLDGGSYGFDRIFIDTPIIDERLTTIDNAEVLEDFPLSPVGSVFEYLHKQRDRVLIFYRGLFKYHGASLLRTLLGDDAILKKISFKLGRVKVTFVLSPRLVIIVSPRNYEVSKIFSYNYIAKFIGHNIKYCSHEKFVKINNQNVDSINGVEEIFLGNESVIDVFKNIDMFKRVGLSRLIYRSIIDNRIQYSCHRAYWDYVNGHNI